MFSLFCISAILWKPALKALQKAKQGIEALITKTVKLDEALHNKIELIKSVNGIGSVTATALLVYTKGFTVRGAPHRLQAVRPPTRLCVRACFATGRW